MKKLLEGIVTFQKSEYEKHKRLFQTMGKSQAPQTLFITCSDSRIVPNMITQSLPGELFIIRNIANLVPPYPTSDDFFSTTSAIEYAVKVLKVDTIVVCGHSNCGGCKALYQSAENMAELPYTKKWLELAEPVKKRALESVDSNDSEALEWMTEQINIVEQMGHLLSYPYIKEKYQKGEIAIIGLYYVIESGEIFSYNKDEGGFILIK